MTDAQRNAGHSARLFHAGFSKRIGEWTGRHILLVAACLVLVLVLARIDDWLYRNETFAWMYAVFEVDPGEPSLVRFEEKAVENCERTIQAVREICRDYQATFLSNAFFLHPLHEIFALGLPAKYGQRPWLEDLHWAAIGALLFGGLLATALWAALVFGLPRGYRSIVAAVTVLMLLFGHYRDEPARLLPDPFANGVDGPEFAGLLVISALILFGHRWAGSLLLHGKLDLAGKAKRFRRRIIQGVGLAVLLNFILPPFGAAAVQLLTFLAFLIAAWWVMEVEDWPRWKAGVILVFLFIMISGDHFHLLRKLEVAHHQLYLVFGAYLVYVALRPRGLLVYLLPALAVFHVPAAALMGLALCLAELPLCLRRWRMTPLFLVSALTFGVSLWVMQRSMMALGTFSDLAIAESVSWLLKSPRLWPTVFMVGLLAGVSLWPLALKTQAYDHVARCGFLALQSLGASALSLAILDRVPQSIVKPEYFMLINLPQYLGPAVAYGVVLNLSLVLFDLGKRRPPDRFEMASHGATEWRGVIPVLGLVFLIGITKIDLSPRFLLVDAVRNGVTYVALQRIHPDWCRNLAQGAGFDDVYILNGQDPTDGVENAFSVLKLRLRLALGVHEPNNMTISVVEPREDGC